MKPIRPRVLLMTRHIPYPPDRSGTSVTVFPILKYLGKDYDIDLVFPVSPNEKLDPDYLNALNNYCRNVLTFNFSKSFFRRLTIAIFHPLPLVFSLYSAKEFRDHIYPLIEHNLFEYNTILIQDTHLARFISRFRLPNNTYTILLVGDYLTLVFRRILKATDKIQAKLYHGLSFLKLVRSEPEIYRAFDTVIYVSSEDKRIITRKYPDMVSKIVVIPIGIDVSTFSEIAHNTASLPNTIVFVGNMNYEPNRHAVTWFYKNVFNLLKIQCKGIMWNIVGRDASRYIKIKDDQVLIKSSVPSVIPYLSDATMVISPLQSGAGLKIKVIEAMACGKVVVGSKLSFDGIPIRQGIHASIASKASDYVAQIKNYIDNPTERKCIETNAIEFVKSHFEVNRSIQRWRKVIEAPGVTAGIERTDLSYETMS